MGVGEILTAVKVFLFVYNLAKKKGKEDIKLVENLAVSSIQSDVKEILNLLHMENWEEVKNAIEIEMNALDDLMEATDYDPASQPWIDWARRVKSSLGGVDADSAGALQTLNRLVTTTEADNVVQLYAEGVKQEWERKVLDEGWNPTKTLHRAVTEFFNAMQVWQGLGFQMLLQANNILYGPTGNDLDYKIFIKRVHDQHLRWEEIHSTISSGHLSLEYVSPHYSQGEIPLSHYKYLHLYAAKPNEGYIVTGFDFDTIGNRVSLRIKQSKLESMGAISDVPRLNEDGSSTHLDD